MLVLEPYASWLSTKSCLRLASDADVVVGIAEERDHIVVAGNDDIAQARIGRPVAVDDALDLLGEEILRVGTIRISLCLRPVREDPRVVLEIDDHASDAGGERRELGEKSRGISGDSRRIRQDDRLAT
jgi:hypothetical protein